MFEKVKEFIVKQLNCDPSIITPETEMTNLGVDSLKFLMIIGDFEEEFRITIANKDLQNIHTIQDLVDKIEK